MGRQECRNGHEWRTRFQPYRSELVCPEPDCGLPAELKLKAKSGLGMRGESPEETKARQHFNDEVMASPCFYAETIDGEKRRRGHECTFPLDAHHVVEKQWIRREFSDLPEDELLAILYDPRIGAPLCRGGHENVKRLRLYWHEISDACKLFCREVDERYGHNHPSMYERLRRECLQDEFVDDGPSAYREEAA